jgi:hypothetical protein
MCTTPDEITASIVCDQIPDAELLTERFVYGADDIDIVAADRTVWLVVRHQLCDRTVDHPIPSSPM